MPGNTAKGYTYPLETDIVGILPNAFEAFANQVDGRLGRQAGGDTVIATAGADNASQAVNFPGGRFTATPNVVATASNSLFNVSVSAISANGCTLTVRHINAVAGSSNVTVYWQATQI